MCRRAGKRENELKDGLHALRASVLRSFPELIADIRVAAMGKGGELSTGLTDITLSVKHSNCNNVSQWCSDCVIPLDRPVYGEATRTARRRWPSSSNAG